MDLRAFQYHTRFLLVMIGFLASRSLFAVMPTEKKSARIPEEIQFSGITFQLNDVTRYLIQLEVDALQSNRQESQRRLEKFALFLPTVETILRENEIPNDFKFLMMYDKYQQSKEVSQKIDPSIFWCLNEERATEVDLKVDAQLDERKHIIMASQGAALSLKRGYILYNNWATVLFSQIADKKVLANLDVNKKWAASQIIQLDNASYAPILQFLAYRIVMEKAFPTYHPVQQNVLYEYPYGRGKTLKKISEELRINEETLNEYNQWFTSDVVPDEEAKVLIYTTADRFHEIRTLADLTQKRRLPTKDLGFPLLKKNMALAQNKGGIFYEINGKKGLQAEMCDNLVMMAYKGDKSIKKFLEYNDMKENDLLHIGEVYYLEKKNKKASVPFHVVREGETYWDISQSYGIKLHELLGYNRTETVQRLQRGRILWMQDTRPKNKPIEYIETPDEFPTENTEIAQRKKIQAPAVANQTMPLAFADTPPIVKEFESKVIPPKDSRIKSSSKTSEINKETSKNEVVKAKEPNKEVPKKNVEQPKIEENDGWNDNKKKIEKQPEQPIISATKESHYIYHTVEKGETLYRVSVNYKVTVESLQKLNNLLNNTIEIGTKLKIKKI